MKKWLAASLTACLLFVGCAGTLRDRVRTTALTTGEAALTLVETERQVYAAGIPGYTQAKHLDAVDKLIVLVTAVRAFERAAAAWPAEMPTMPKDVWQAQADALAAIAAVQHIIEGVPGTAKLAENLNLVKFKLGGS